jgi:hypothetical protein
LRPIGWLLNDNQHEVYYLLVRRHDEKQDVQKREAGESCRRIGANHRIETVTSQQRTIASASRRNGMKSQTQLIGVQFQM